MQQMRAITASQSLINKQLTDKRHLLAVKSLWKNTYAKHDVYTNPLKNYLTQRTMYTQNHSKLFDTK